MTQSNCCSNGCGAKLILRGVGSAIRPGRLLFAVFCLAAFVGGGHIWDAIVGDWISASSLKHGIGGHGNVAPFELTMMMFESALGSIKVGIMQFEPSVIVDGVVSLVAGIPAALWTIGAHWFVLLFGIYALVILGVSIGIQCRFEAIVVAEQEPPSMDRLIGESGAMSGNFIGALGTPFVILAILALMIMLAGFVLLNVPVLNVLGGIVWGVVMLLGLAMAVVLLGLAVAGTLLLPAVAVDGCSGPDAMHRAFCGATTRPLIWLWYIALITIGLGLGLLVVETVASVAAALIMGLGDAWVFNKVFAEVAVAQSGGELTAHWTTTATASIVAFWMKLLYWFVAGWVLCYLAAATTRAWMMLRLRLDGIAQDDIWRPGLMPGTLAPMCREADAYATVDDASTEAHDDD